jgi:hypothetical protein
VAQAFGLWEFSATSSAETFLQLKLPVEHHVLQMKFLPHDHQPELRGEFDLFIVE